MKYSMTYRHESTEIYQYVSTWRADAVLIEHLMPPHGLPRLGVEHRSHHLVVRLVGVALQVHLLIAIHQTPTKPCI